MSRPLDNQLPGVERGTCYYPGCSVMPSCSDPASPANVTDGKRCLVPEGLLGAFTAACCAAPTETGFGGGGAR
eukprot:1786192-Pyramimonas_sp.AAC.1